MKKRGKGHVRLAFYLSCCLAVFFSSACTKKGFSNAPQARPDPTRGSSSLPQQNSTATTYTMGAFKLDLDNKTGCPLKIAHLDIGTFLSAPAADCRLLQVALPVPTFLPLQFTAGDGVATTTSYGHIHLEWKSLQKNRSEVAPELGEGALSATADIVSSADGHALIFSAKVWNHSKGATIQRIFFPYFAGLSPNGSRFTYQMAVGHGAIFSPFVPEVWKDLTLPYNLALWQQYDFVGYGVELPDREIVLRNGWEKSIHLFQNSATVWAKSVLYHLNQENSEDLHVTLWHNQQIGPGGVFDSGKVQLRVE